MEMKRRLFSISDAATVLGIGRSHAYTLISNGALETVHIGKRHLVTAESIDRLVETAMAKKTPGPKKRTPPTE